MLNQFVWGLQLELARSVSLHYPKSIAQAVALAETTELAVKASRRPAVRGQQSSRPQMNQNRGQGQWRKRGQGRFGGTSSMASNTRRSTGGNRRGGGSRNTVSSGSVNFDPLACYRCGRRGHLARDCSQAAQAQRSGNTVPSTRRFSQSGQKGPRSRGNQRQTRFGAMGVMYDAEGCEYPIDEHG